MNHSDKKSAMVAASFLLAIVSIVTFQIFSISLPCASLSIILALISRGDGPLLPRAKAALACAAGAAILTTSVTLVSVYTVMHDPALRQEVQQLYDYYTNPDAVQPDDGNTKSGEALLRDILSGKYRERKQEGSTPLSSFDDLPDTSEIPSPEQTLPLQNGGPVI